MNKNTKKILKVTGIASGILIVTASAIIAMALNIVFTSEKLTPIVLKVANSKMNAKLDMKSVELTFFSTFPRFGLKLTDGTLISKAIRDTMWQRTDTLLSFKKAVLVINPVEYLKQQKISIYRLLLDSANVYAYKDKNAKVNWDIMVSDTTKANTVEKNDTTRIANEIDIRNITLRHTTVTFDDRETHIFSNLWDTNLTLKAKMKKKHSELFLDLINKNIFFWQNGQLVANHISTHLKTRIELDRTGHILSLHDALIDVNGIKLDVKGHLRRDTVAKALDVDLQYGLHAPSLETVLNLIPESILKKEKVSTKGEVTVKGTLKGLYGREKMPVGTLDIKIDNASFKYGRMPYGVDKLEADFSAQVDLMRQIPSYLHLRKLHLKGAHTDILADAKVENLLGDPNVLFHTRSSVDLTALAQTFPLQEGVCIEGGLETDLNLYCRLSYLKKQDLGRIKAGGKIRMDKLVLQDRNKDFEFTGNASLAFVGNECLGIHTEIKNLSLRSLRLKSDLESLAATIKTTNPQDTARIAQMECKIGMDKLKIALEDSLNAFCGKGSATIKLEPDEQKSDKPKVKLSLETDTLFCRMGDTKFGMDKAGIGVTARKLRDSLWIPKGIVGFNRLVVSTSQCALPIRLQRTSVTVGDRTIALRNATMRVGHSEFTASGTIYDLYGAMRHRRMLHARLELSSDNLNCNQLIRSISFPADTLNVEKDTTSTDLRLFVIPKNIDFELQTNLRRVRYERMLFENIHGAVDIRNQAIHLKELSMKGLGAEMRTSLVYQAKQPEQGYAGFDFRLHKIDIGKLVDFIPSLDTIVPMLRSFEGRVDFNIAAESALDSSFNIKVPSLRSAIHVRGDSLVLMDGETFAEISKKFLFKNKKRNLIDSISVNISIKDGNVTVYPFEISMDRYRAAVGGTQGLDMNFDYHISILKSPIPFKLGLNISGNLDDMKFRLGKAKYKNAVTPVEIHKVDSTIVNMGKQIADDFRKIVRRNQ